jgi:aryl-alcohol dehydrogenase-like predicted oxidoreductase
MGSSQLQISEVGLGCNNFGWRIDAVRTREVVDAAIDAGITLFDTADMYGNKGGSEELLGQALGTRRDDVVIATKFGHQQAPMGYSEDLGPMGGRAYIRYAVEQSLRRLGTDRIDLYQIHTPDPKTPIGETLTALHELVQEGKVRYIGSSQFAAWQVVEAAYVAKQAGLSSFVSAQNQWSLLERDAERELLPAAQAYGVGILPFFPLASGLLTGKVRKDQPVPAGSRLEGRAGSIKTAHLDIVEALVGWGSDHGRTLLELAFGWLLAHPQTGSVIAGATSADQVRANVAAADRLLTDDEVAGVTAVLAD